MTAALIVTDLEHKLVPNRILYLGTALTTVLLRLGALVDQSQEQLAEAAFGSALCLVGTGVLAVTGRGALGMGDVKLSALLGLLLGYRGVANALQAILAGFLIGGVVSVILMLSRRAHRPTRIPFALSLVAGAWWSLLGAPLGPSSVLSNFVWVGVVGIQQVVAQIGSGQDYPAILMTIRSPIG